MKEKGSFEFHCPVCGRELTFPMDYAGLVQPCPFCFKTIVVPTDDSNVGGLLPLPLKTPRLVVRPFEPTDLPDLVQLFSDERSFEYTDAYPVDDAAVREWFEASKKAQLTDEDGYLNLAAQPADGSGIVGYVSFFFTDDERMKYEHRSGTFTMIIAPEHRRRGYGIEIVRAILRFGFGGINLHDIRVSVDSRHVAARTLLERVGMVKEGEFVENKFVKGQWVSTTCYRLLRPEYLGNPTRFASLQSGAQLEV